MGLNTSSTGPKYQTVVDVIRKDIECGRYKEGNSLPSISECASALGFSRSTVQRAYEVLVDEGEISSIPGRGFIVVVKCLPAESDASDLRVFWSYAHKDDERSHGAITQLRKSIQDEYELQTGNEANIFQDTKDIGWGTDWRQEINKSLGATTFFVPILTPTYLRQSHCLAELRSAAAHFEQMGYEEGIYPIELVDSTKAIEALPDDGLANLLRDTQRVRNWIDLRSEDPGSSNYAKGVREIVEELLAREERLSLLRMEDLSATAPFPDEDDYEGTLEKIARIENAVTELNDTGQYINGDLNLISNTFSNIDAGAASGPRQVLGLAGRIAQDLEVPSRSLEKHCSTFSNCMREVGTGIDGLIELYQLQTEMGTDVNAADYDILVNLHCQVKDLQATMGEPLSQLDEMRTMLKSFSRLARVLRAPCRRINGALDDLASSKYLIDGWERQLSYAVEINGDGSNNENYQ